MGWNKYQYIKETNNLNAEQRLRGFYKYASTQAKELLELLAVVPLSLPIIKLVQKKLLPQSNQEHLSEVFMSSIIDKEQKVDGFYQFSKFKNEEIGVREELLKKIGARKAFETIVKLSEVVQKQGAVFDFLAYVVNPDSLKQSDKFSEIDREFAHISVSILHEMGGKYHNFIDNLIEIVSPIENKLEKYVFKILHIDDDFINQKIIKSLLKRYHKNIIIIEAENGEDGLEKFKNKADIDLIILDNMMPIMDGLEFLKIFRANINNDNIPIIFKSGRPKDFFHQALELGANDTLDKSIHKEEILFNKLDFWLKIDREKRIIQKTKIKKIGKYLTSSIFNTSLMISRERELNEITNLVKNEKGIVIRGDGGIGKTSLVAKYLAKNEKNYEHIAYIPNYQNLKQDFIKYFSDILGVKNKTIKEVMSKLIGLKNNKIIIDNVTEDIKKYRGYLNQLYRDGWYIILLTRISKLDILIKSSYQLKGLSKGEAKELFLHYKNINNIEYSQYEKLFEVVKYNPSKIISIAKQNASFDEIVDTLLSSLSEKEKLVLRNKLGLVHDRNNSDFDSSGLHSTPKEFDESFDSFYKGVGIDPNNATYFYDLGKTYFKIKNYDRAIEVYLKAIRIEPENSAFYNSLGLVYFEKLDYPKATELYNKALELNPNLIEAQKNLKLVENKLKEDIVSPDEKFDITFDCEKCLTSYGLDCSELEWEVVESHERHMGLESNHEAYYEETCDSCSTDMNITFNCWEYPAEVEEIRDIKSSGIMNLKGDCCPNFSLDDDSDVYMMVEWFYQNYEDPAERLPYETRAGGYQYIHGEPMFPEEALLEKFEGKYSDRVIKKAVAEIEDMEWSPIPQDEEEFQDMVGDWLKEKTIVSQIDGDFNGWDGETIVKLINGEFWQQSKYDYNSTYSFMPKVKIVQSSNGYKMEVEGSDIAVDVVRLVDVIESKIDGEFNGWDGETVVELMNGQKWKQSSYEYNHSYKYRPDVIIYKLNGGYKMKVDGSSETVEVEKV